ncbi:hypothetical protein GC087_01415 [Pantoea sp. JZ2]|uniref:hypothetical protein n=1 Tax=Pantoea sp. JZ2 TaxID=2654189 RepID=UPI002B48C56F|nr:hypothetical protein [Pantoea sp. JZ2]WRH11367.1 hypothetical protein GC087_01415 [Pantoea sp. JZ2]
MDKQTPVHVASELYGLETIIRAAMEMDHRCDDEYEITLHLLERAIQRCVKTREAVETAGVHHV